MNGNYTNSSTLFLTSVQQSSVELTGGMWDLGLMGTETDIYKPESQGQLNVTDLLDRTIITQAQYLHPDIVRQKRVIFTYFDLYS